MTSGWQNSDLIIVAARPAMGKTAFVVSLARNAAIDFKRPIAVFSLEMASVQLVTRLISSECDISAQQLKSGKLEERDWQNINIRISPLCEAPLFIDDTPAISLFELRAKSRRLVANNGVQMIIVDYLQLMTGGDSFNREQEISTISRGLKSLAKELNVPVIALSQLSRAVETRGGDKRPQLSDLRESGAIEQDADMVMFIHRPEYYGFTQDADGNNTAGVAEIIIAKHRNGPVGSVALRFIDRLAKFEDITNPFVPDGVYDPSAGLTPNTEFNTVVRQHPASGSVYPPDSDPNNPF
jgi:replicative DNA helicase